MCLRDPNQGRSVKLNGRRVSPKSDGLSCLSSYRVYPHFQTRPHDSFATSASASLIFGSRIQRRLEADGKSMKLDTCIVCRDKHGPISRGSRTGDLGI